MMWVIPEFLNVSSEV